MATRDSAPLVEGHAWSRAALECCLMRTLTRVSCAPFHDCSQKMTAARKVSLDALQGSSMDMRRWQVPVRTEIRHLVISAHALGVSKDELADLLKQAIDSVYPAEENSLDKAVAEEDKAGAEEDEDRMHSDLWQAFLRVKEAESESGGVEMEAAQLRILKLSFDQKDLVKAEASLNSTELAKEMIAQADVKPAVEKAAREATRAGEAKLEALKASDMLMHLCTNDWRVNEEGPDGPITRDFEAASEDMKQRLGCAS